MSGEDWKPIAVPIGAALDAAKQPAATETLHAVSRRADAMWKRMQVWYPNKLAPVPPLDYCRLIDASSREKLVAVMATMRSRHLTWPPTFPEFALLFTEQQKQESSINWPEILNNFTDKLLRAGAITIEQSRRITWLGSGGQPGTAVTFTGLSVPAIGNAPAKTIRIDEWAHR